MDRRKHGKLFYVYINGCMINCWNTAIDRWKYNNFEFLEESLNQD